MSQKKLLALYGLKWNPFASDMPCEGIHLSQSFENFAWRVESLTLDGGFALITGDPGLGKSIAMRSLHEHLSRIRDIQVTAWTRPQSGLVDFYREIGHLFGIDLKTSNRWGGYRALREKWLNHISSTLLRPVILIDEAQEMPLPVLSELRLLASAQYDSQILLTVVFSGDSRFTERLKTPELLPLGTRLRTRLVLESQPKNELTALLREVCCRAGAPQLMSDDLYTTIAEHSAGNIRIMMGLAKDVLALGCKKEHTPQLNASLYFEAFPRVQSPGTRKPPRPTQTT